MRFSYLLIQAAKYGLVGWLAPFERGWLVFLGTITVFCVLDAADRLLARDMEDA